MMLNEPITSSSHWRIPRPELATQDAPVAVDERSPLAVAARLGSQAQTAGRSAANAIVAGLLVGGVLVAPALATLAILALFVPQLAGARHIAPALIFGALLWLAMAILGAHAQVERQPDDHDTDDVCL